MYPACHSRGSRNNVIASLIRRITIHTDVAYTCHFCGTLRFKTSSRRHARVARVCARARKSAYYFFVRYYVFCACVFEHKIFRRTISKISL